MRGLFVLALAHARHHAVRSLLLATCLSITIALPITTSSLMVRYEEDLVARGQATPLLAGPEGNRFDLTLGALYFRANPLRTLDMASVDALLAEAEKAGGAVVVPVHTRASARGHALVGTVPEYFEVRGLAAASGTLPVFVGDAVLGARVAEALELKVGSTLFSDPEDALDIATPAALELAITGVLAPTGTADDDAVFVDLKTAWAIEGLGHGHGDVTAEGALPEGFVLSRTEDQVAVSPALIEERRLSGANAGTFHLHGDPASLPVSAALIFPDSRKAGTLLRSTADRWEGLQVLAPAKVIDDLLAFVLELKRLFDRLSSVLLLSAVLSSALVLLLSARLREAEFRTLHAIGCAPSAVVKLVLLEALCLVLFALVLAALWSGLALTLLPNLITTL